ncbi:MAG: FkbM family methyltransferase [Oscillospiraceae bacterium]
MINEILQLNSSWEMLQKATLPIIMYGTGDGGDKVLYEFSKLNIKISGIMVSDGFARGQSFHGFKVGTLSYFESVYDDFIVAVSFGTQIPEVIENIKSIMKIHKVLMPCVPVYGEELFDRYFIENHKEKLNSVYEILADEKSKSVFECVLKFELTGDFKYLFESETDKKEAFQNILKLKSNENYLDLGAYKGDTINEFLSICNGNYESILALEPDCKTFKKLSAFCSDLKNCECLEMGVWSEKSTLVFENKAGRNSKIGTEKGENVSVVSIDELCKDKNISYIKADVEGAEFEMLLGSQNVLKTKKPKLNIAVYHKSEDIFKLPLKILEINPQYKIYLRHHPYIPCWDLNLYAF